LGSCEYDDKIIPADEKGDPGKDHRRRQFLAPRLEAIKERRALSYTITNLGSLGGTFGIPLDINNVAQWLGSRTPPYATIDHGGKVHVLGNATDRPRSLAYASLSRECELDNTTIKGKAAEVVTAKSLTRKRFVNQAPN
jgi:hypothetical protein